MAVFLRLEGSLLTLMSRAACYGGRDLLERGMRWRVGDGKTIKIYNDRWIPRPTDFKILSPPNLGVNATVDSLVSPTGGWNMELIRNNFLP